MQDILAERKKVLLARDVPARKVPHWPQLAVKNMYPQMLRLHPGLIDYLPALTGEKDLRYPERDYFYRILNSLYPETYDELIEQAAKSRKPKAKNLQDEQWALAIKADWMDQLLRYDYISCK